MPRRSERCAPWTGMVPAASERGLQADERPPQPGRGHYTIYLGMAAGVGKTYRMLVEAHAEQEAGRDVVIGLLETHGREETAAAAWPSPRRIQGRRARRA